MAEEENKKIEEGGKDPGTIKKIDPVPPSKDLEREKPTPTQKAIEDEVARLEKEYGGEKDLSSELSKNRTHMSEHRTRLSEHRTDLSEHRTELSDHRTELSEHRTSLSEDRTGLSYERTALSYERTLMSWIRTATSLISFGFTIYKFFEEVQKTKTGTFVSPRMIGMIMIGFGVVGLLFAQIQHVRAYKKLRAHYPSLDKSLSSILGILILTVGLFLFLMAMFKQ